MHVPSAPLPTHRRLTLAAAACAAAGGLLATLALLGYVIDLPLLIHVHTGLEGMSPLTATSLLALAAAAGAAMRGWHRPATAAATLAATAVTITLTTRALHGSDTASLWVGETVFRMPPHAVGRTSIATAIGVLLLASSLAGHRRPHLADAAAGAGLLISGVALLGYLYGVRDLYALPMFGSMALNTAAGLALLSVAALLVERSAGWAAVIGARGASGLATRRQLAFVALPIVAGKLLLVATGRAQLGAAVAMALLVIVTVFPLAWLVLRDGEVLGALDRERRERVREQDRVAAEMTERLAHQAEELARESDERARAEAAMYRAQRMEAVGQLTGGIAHDFNNLLMAIRGNLELVEQGLTAGEAALRPFVANAMRATDKGAKVTGQLLAFSRSQFLNIRVVELDPVLEGARTLIGHALGHTIELGMHLDSAGATVTTDPDQLELALLNLAVNSRDAMPAGGRIRIETSLCEAALGAEATPEPCVAIRVADTGAGMTPEVAARAIEPFFTTKERGRGTGLGLAQVYGFVRQCGGDLRIASSPGEGTTVEILLRRADLEPARAPGAAALQGAGGTGALGRQVLVIDDDDGVRAVIVASLVSAGFRVAEAADGKSGLDLLETARPDVAVIDFLMPGMNGAEVARIAQARRPGLPIVFVSGYSDTLTLDGIAGAVVLRKPFDMEGLNRALTAVLH